MRGFVLGLLFGSMLTGLTVWAGDIYDPKTGMLGFEKRQMERSGEPWNSYFDPPSTYRNYLEGVNKWGPDPYKQKPC